MNIGTFRRLDNFPKPEIKEEKDRKKIPAKDLDFSNNEDEDNKAKNPHYSASYQTANDVADNSWQTYGEQLEPALVKEIKEAPELLTSQEEEDLENKIAQENLEEMTRPQEFSETELTPENTGKIEVASVDAKNMEIKYQRSADNQQDDSTSYSDVFHDEENEELSSHENIHERTRKIDKTMNRFPNYNGNGDNLKTFSESKRQRSFRGFLRDILGKN